MKLTENILKKIIEEEIGQLLDEELDYKSFGTQFDDSRSADAASAVVKHFSKKPPEATEISDGIFRQIVRKMADRYQLKDDSMIYKSAKRQLAELGYNVEFL